MKYGFYLPNSGAGVQPDALASIASNTISTPATSPTRVSISIRDLKSAINQRSSETVYTCEA